MSSGDRNATRTLVQVDHAIAAAFGPIRGVPGQLPTPHSGVRLTAPNVSASGSESGAVSGPMRVAEPLSGPTPRAVSEVSALSAPSDVPTDERTMFDFQVPVLDDLPLDAFVIPREPRTEPHLAVADPFDFDAEPPTRARPTLQALAPHGATDSPDSQTRLEIAPPISGPRASESGSLAQARTHAGGGGGGDARERASREDTLCSPGVVRRVDPIVDTSTTLPHFPFEEAVTSVAGVPRPMMRPVMNWVESVSQWVLDIALAFGGLFRRR